MNEDDKLKKYKKFRPRTGARWFDDEMRDLENMVKESYSLSVIADCLQRTENATLSRIMKNGMAKDAIKYMPEAKEYDKAVRMYSHVFDF